MRWCFDPCAPPRNSAAKVLLIALVACTPGSEEARDGDRVLARVAGEAIWLSDVRGAIAFQIYRREVDIHSLIQRETRRLVEQRLLAQEASARGVAPEALLAEAEAGLAPVTEAEVDAYLAEHPGDAPDATARPRIRFYLSETRRQEQRLAYLAGLRERAGVEILLEPPVAPRTRIDIEGAPSRGPAQAPITIVHFAALTSTESARSSRGIARLRGELGDQLRVVYRHYPKQRDELGLRVAQLAVAAQDAGSFWSLHDALRGFEARPTRDDVVRIAASLGLADRFTSIAGDTATLARVKRDIDAANRAGVRRAPTLFVNGRYFMGLFPYERLRALALEELEAESEDS